MTDAGGTPLEFAIPASEQGAPSEYEGIAVTQPDDQTVFALVYTDANGETQIATLEEQSEDQSSE